MALELVTGYWGQQHVTAEQDADLNAGIIGREPCILRVGENMRAEAVTANKVRIFDGIFVGYGRVCAIDEGAYEDVEIENGTAGLLRNDMIVIKYAKDEATGIEGVSLAVLKGQTGETATDPTPNNQDIRAGAFESEMPLYRVRLNGLAIEAVERICEMPRTIKDLTSLFGQLNSNLSQGGVDNGVGYSKFPDGTYIQWGFFGGTAMTNSNKNATRQVTFRENFAGTAPVSVLITPANANYLNGYCVDNIVVTGCRVILMGALAANTTYDSGFRWLAIGRWK